MIAGEVERAFLPKDGYAGTLIGRAWVPATDGMPGGPAVVSFRDDGVHDITRVTATCSALCNANDPLALARATEGVRHVGALKDVLENSLAEAPDPGRPYLLAPIDLQVVKAAGVTFAHSLLERVIEERAKGDPTRADDICSQLTADIGGDVATVKPGSPEADRLKETLVAQGLWSQYLEVGIGPDAEVFTKCPVLASVGFGAGVGIHPKSTWNNPEPEVVLVASAAGQLVGATLDNDVNLRDFEGRSALLLSKAKDNNGSCAVGPFIRLLDDTFGVDDVRNCAVRLRVSGEDGFELTDGSAMSEISRDVLDLIAQTANENHQYPDGFVLFTGTMFAPTQDRGAPGQGFTHHVGDVVEIAADPLGTLRNTVRLSCDLPPWEGGIGALMRSLAARGLLG